MAVSRSRRTSWRVDERGTIDICDVLVQVGAVARARSAVVKTMLPISTANDRVKFGERFVLRFERTLRVPDDGRTYPLPPGLGRFQVFRVSDYSDRVPAAWLKEDGVFISMRQSEALWLSFDSAPWK